MFNKLKEKLIGWSVSNLAFKLAGRYIPIASAFLLAFFSKWAPDSSSTPDQLSMAIATILWALFETSRNMAKYVWTRKAEK